MENGCEKSWPFPNGAVNAPVPRQEQARQAQSRQASHFRYDVIGLFRRDRVTGAALALLDGFRGFPCAVCS